MLAKLCGGLGFLFAPAGMADWRITYAAVAGLIAKENVAGAIALFYGSFPFSAASAFAFSVFLLTCSPCVSAITAAARELGRRAAARNALFQTLSALLMCYLVYFSIKGLIVYAALAAVPVVALLLITKTSEKHIDSISGNNARPPFRLHRRHLRTGIGVLSRSLKGEGDSGKRRKSGLRLHAKSG